jgi:hypothetical protein
VTLTPYQSPTASPTVTQTFTITQTFTVTDTPLPTQTPEAPAVLSHNIWRPSQGPLHIGIKPPQSGQVRVSVYTLAAEKTGIVFEGWLPAGVTHDAVWDGRNNAGEACAGGTYVISIQGAGISRLLKVNLLK